MSVLPNSLEVTQTLIDVITKAVDRLEKEHNTFSCVAIAQAYYEIDYRVKESQIELVYDAYRDYVINRVFQVKWESHRDDHEVDADEKEMFDSFFGMQWQEFEDRKAARITALTQFAKYLSTLLEKQNNV